MEALYKALEAGSHYCRDIYFYSSSYEKEALGLGKHVSVNCSLSVNYTHSDEALSGDSCRIGNGTILLVTI